MQRLMLPKADIEDNIISALNNTDELVSGSTKSEIMSRKIETLHKKLNNTVNNNSVFKSLQFNKLTKEETKNDKIAVYRKNNDSLINEINSLKFENIISNNIIEGTNSSHSKLDLLNNLNCFDELEVPLNFESEARPINVIKHNDNAHNYNHCDIDFKPNDLVNGIRIYKEYDEVLGKTVTYKTRIIESTEKLKLEDIKNNKFNLVNGYTSVNTVNNFKWDNINKYNIKQAVKQIKSSKNPKVKN